MQRPLGGSMTLLRNKLTDADIAEMKRKAAEHFDEIVLVLKAMPREMLLVIRCASHDSCRHVNDICESLHVTGYIFFK